MNQPACLINRSPFACQPLEQQVDLRFDQLVRIKRFVCENESPQDRRQHRGHKEVRLKRGTCAETRRARRRAQ